MSKLFYPDFFNDVFGPIMQPGSSSSFGGTSRVGRIARATLKSEPKAAKSESSIFLVDAPKMPIQQALSGYLLSIWWRFPSFFPL